MVNGFKTTLKELMSDSGYNAVRLGNAIGVNMFVVRKWLDKVKDVKLKSLLKIADFFGCSLEYNTFYFLPERSKKIFRKVC